MSTKSYDAIHKILHWTTTLCVFGLFALGWWMVDLDYYSQWYQTAPHWHKSVGLLLAAVTLFRLIYKFIASQPEVIASHPQWQRKLTKAVHSILLGVLVIVLCSGYLISTADNRAIEVFNWFEVPALGELFSNQEDISGAVHWYSALILILLATGHALMAIKHHFIDKDETLIRMIK